MLRSPIRTLLVAALLASCSGDRTGGSFDDDVPEAERYGGTAVIGGYGDLQPINPLTSSDNNTGLVERNVLFMTLLRYDDGMRLTPYLAESWDTVRVHPDSLELTFRIRRDIRWHDGTPTTAEDVAFTFDRMKDPLSAYPRAEGFAQYAPHARVIDPYTVALRLRVHAEFLDIFTMTAMTPKHLLEPVPPAEMLNHPFGYQPVGNGPFRFVRHVPGQEWVFAANEEFPADLGGRPYLDRVVYRAIPQMTTLLTELLTGRIDIYLQPNPADAEIIQRSEGTELRTYPARQYNYLAFNTRLPIFNDPRTRRAIGMAINREEIVRALVYGYGTPGRSTVPPTNWAYDSTATLPYDPEGARRLLEEAGWRPGRDGVLQDAEGRPLRFTIVTNDGNDVRRDMAVIIQAQLRPLGIVAQPRLIEWTTLISQLQGSISRSGNRERNFEAVISGWVTDERISDAGILHSRSLNQPYQYVGYSNPEVDRLIETLDLMVDREQALPLWHEYQRLIAYEAPYVPLYYPERLNGIRTRLRGVVFDTRGELVTVQKWWLHPSARSAGGEVPRPASEEAEGEA